MAHFAELNSENKVLRVVVINNEDIIDSGKESEQKGIDFCKSLFGQDTIWVQTSYSAKIRGKYAGPGDIYNQEKDIFEVIND